MIETTTKRWNDGLTKIYEGSTNNLIELDPTLWARTSSRDPCLPNHSQTCGLVFTNDNNVGCLATRTKHQVTSVADQEIIPAGSEAWCDVMWNMKTTLTWTTDVSLTLFLSLRAKCKELVIRLYVTSARKRRCLKYSRLRASQWFDINCGLIQLTLWSSSWSQW